MRIGGDWLVRPETRSVCDALTRDGAQLFFVGGCVRNALLGEPVGDLDLASDAHPDRITALAEAAGLKVIPTGIVHGTVTIVVNDTPFEVTTFRKDMETDGRHAIVQFSTSLEEDAARRDFTINALYADRDGRVVDPLDGYRDLVDRRIRFIGNATSRIREDFLRSLRFFRFFAWYGDPQLGLDNEALAAIAAEVEGLSSLSRERVGVEILKLLAAPDPAQAVAAMRMTGVLRSVLPGADDRALGPMLHIETQAALAPEPIRRLAALGSPDIAEGLRLSKANMRRLCELRNLVESAQGPQELAYRHGVDLALDVLALRAALTEQPWPIQSNDLLQNAAQQRFPLKAKDLMPDFKGADLGRALKSAESDWIHSDFRLDREALLTRLKNGDADR